MAGKNVFLLGAGYIGREVVDRLLEEHYSVTVLVRREAAAKELNDAGILTRFGDLEDSATITDQTAKSDIVFHIANADHLPSVQAVLAGVTQRAQSGKSTIFIHTSGSGVLDDKADGAFKTEHIYSDEDPDKIDTIPDNAPHREVDLAVLQTRKELGAAAKMVIIMPPLIHGVNPKYNRTSIQLPTLLRFALKHGYAPYVGEGAAVWAPVHVADLARAYIILLHWAESTDSQEVLKNPYFFAENGTEFTWKDLAAGIGKTLHKAGKISSAEPKQVPEEEFKDLFGPYTLFVFGSNSRIRADRLRALGWKPTEKSVYESIADEELPLIVQEKGEFNGYAPRQG